MKVLFSGNNDAAVERIAMAENNFSEPARIYSNIVNGYGILGTYNAAEMTLKVPRE